MKSRCLRARACRTSPCRGAHQESGSYMHGELTVLVCVCVPNITPYDWRIIFACVYFLRAQKLRIGNAHVAIPDLCSVVFASHYAYTIYQIYIIYLSNGIALRHARAVFPCDARLATSVVASTPLRHTDRCVCFWCDEFESLPFPANASFARYRTHTGKRRRVCALLTCVFKS